MNEQEIITELEYLIERGVPAPVEAVFLVIAGTIKTGDDELLTELMRHNQMFAHAVIGRMKK